MAQEIKHVTLSWNGALQFQGGDPSGPSITIDADNASAPGPMLLLLLAAASCTASDVVMILEKMRQPLTRFSIDAAGTRREKEPRRYVGMHFIYRMHGEGLEQDKARRAVELSVEKYCSVMATLAKDTAVSYDVVVNDSRPDVS